MPVSEERREVLSSSLMSDNSKEAGDLSQESNQQMFQRLSHKDEAADKTKETGRR